MENNPFEKFEVENIVKSTEKEVKLKIDDIPIGQEISIETTSGTMYKLERRPDGLYISGNQKYCPEPSKVNINGCTWGGSMIVQGIISEGMRLEYFLPEKEKTITSSTIKKIGINQSSLSA